ncbi:MAG TPA: hypothetical protein VNP73_05845 [Actinomycetota bacterium]|nr:hypothetical protein [Actinomycetota bacterium]
MTVQRIKAEFDARWESWGVALPEEDLTARRGGALRQVEGSGLIRYAFGKSEDDREYLEYYSFHRIGGDSHGRIYDTGEFERLDSLQTMYISSGTEEEVRRRKDEMYERNRKLLEDLHNAGLMDGGPVPHSFQINAYLTTDDRDSDDSD